MTDALQEYMLSARAAPSVKAGSDHTFFIFEWNDELTKTLKLDAITLLQAAKYFRSTVRTVTVLGMTGQAYIKNYSGTDYLILKGRAGERPKRLQGTRYLAENPKINFMSVGVKGILKGAKEAVVVGIFAYVALDIARALFGDLDTIGKFTGTLGMDIAKCIAASATGFAVAAGTVSGAIFIGLSVGVAGPMIIALVTGVIIAGILEGVDEKYRITERVCSTIDNAIEDARNKITNVSDATNSTLIMIERGLATSSTYQTLREAIQRLFPGHYMPQYEIRLQELCGNLFPATPRSAA